VEEIVSEKDNQECVERKVARKSNGRNWL